MSAAVEARRGARMERVTRFDASFGDEARQVRDRLNKRT